MSSAMALRCLLRRIPRRSLAPPAVPPPAASRSMTTACSQYQLLNLEIDELVRLNELLQVRREASFKEAMEMERVCIEAGRASSIRLDEYARALEYLGKLKKAASACVAGLSGFTVLDMAIDYCYP